MRKFIVVSLCLLGISAGYAREISFARDAWKSSEWTFVKSPRWTHKGGWEQHDDHISNAVPADASPADLLGKRVAETYTSMIWNRPVKGDFEISSTMLFTGSMAPLLVLAGPLGTSADHCPEYREHWEVVLWDQGINIWHHNYQQGKPFWHLAAALKHPFQPNRKYALKLHVQRTRYGAKMTVECDGATLIYTEHDLPEILHVGLTGCEGLNRFYSFGVTP